MSSDRLLIRGGLVIDTEPEPHVRPNSDVLVEAGRVAAVGRGLSDAAAEVVDAERMIVMPGLVDAHRHVWQTALRGAAVEDDLATYLQRVLGEFAPGYRPEDVYAANFAGALECLDAGVTTVQDFSHVNYTPTHSDAAVDAFRASGLRVIVGYSFPDFDMASRRPDEVRRLRESSLADDSALVTMALAAAGPSYTGFEHVKADWMLARDLGLRITAHVSSGPVTARPMAMLRDQGLLEPDSLYVHGNSLPDDELDVIADSGGAVAIAPAVEARMGHGAAMVGRLRERSVATGLGVDVVTTVSGDMFALMRATLISGHLTAHATLSAADVLRLATIDGARAVGLGDRVGSLLPGKQADLIMLRTDDLNLAGARADLVGAVVTAANAGNVDTVLVGGRVVKRAGRLVGVDVGRATDALWTSADYVISRSAAG